MSVRPNVPERRALQGWRWWLATGLVLVGALAATVPTTGDIGLTWDEPAYRYSQLMSIQWWQRLAAAPSRGWGEVRALVEPGTLLYYWPYARHGINFHPPLAGQLDLLTYVLFGKWVKDIPARRLASVFEYALAIALGFGFLARRYGAWVGGVAAGALLFMPRVYGDGHIAGTDTPGLLLWPATALAFWKGLYEPDGRRWRVAVGLLVGLGFVEKMAAVLVLLPLMGWLVASHAPRALRLARPETRADWIDGLATGLALAAPLLVALVEILRLAGRLPAPAYTDLFRDRPRSRLPGVILVVPSLVWVGRRMLGWVFPRHPVLGVERPALETWTSIAAFAPLVGWLGNPAWWRETMPRLAHYYLLNTGREGALPDIRIYYLGQTYVFSLPWHNAWVLMAVTVPATLLAAALLGLVHALRNARRDRLPIYFVVHLVTLPVLRMLPTPAHDGVRLFLPTFFFLAAMAGWGAIDLADRLARWIPTRVTAMRSVLALLVLAPAAWQLIQVHPYELSYYNELIGGPRGAWRRGFELAYWWDAFNDRTLAALNDRLPHAAVLEMFNERTDTLTTFEELQSLGALRSDIRLRIRDPNVFPYVWLLTQDSKASPLTRLFFVMRPWYAVRPRQLGGLRVATVDNPVAASRAWALWLLAGGRDARRVAGKGPSSPLAPPTAGEAVFEWARADPGALRAAARAVAGGTPDPDDAGVRRLQAILRRYDQPGEPGGRFSERLFSARPQALAEAVEILILRGEAVHAVLTRFGYTDPDDIGGYLDSSVPSSVPVPHDDAAGIIDSDAIEAGPAGARLVGGRFRGDLEGPEEGGRLRNQGSDGIDGEGTDDVGTVGLVSRRSVAGGHAPHPVGLPLKIDGLAKVFPQLGFVEEAERKIVHEKRQIVSNLSRRVGEPEEPVNQDSLRIAVPDIRQEFRFLSSPVQAVADVAAAAHPLDVDCRLDAGDPLHQRGVFQLPGGTLGAADEEGRINR
jgi:4-amino-4-deoxy-L-arabinose transferase-like glycosyltransferase